MRLKTLTLSNVLRNTEFKIRQEEKHTSPKLHPIRGYQSKHQRPKRGY